MFTISEAEARRESFVRSSGFSPGAAVSYNTGAAVSAGNAEQYLLATVANMSYSNTGLKGTLATGVTLPVMVRLVRVDKPKRLSNLAPVSPADMLESLRRAFSLRVSEAAAVLRVSRPTIYQWSSLYDVSLIRAEADRARLQNLYRIALRWSERGSPAQRAE